MLKVDNINVYYGQIHALKDVSIEVHQGEVVALIGANGAGKSTTLRTISGLLRSKTGSITLLDEDISKTEACTLVSKGLAHVPEGRRIFLQMTVLENLEMGAYTDPSNVKAGIEDVFKRFPRLKHRKNQIAGTLSGGNQQKVVISKWLANNPKVLVLDEPTRGIDVGSKAEIYRIINDLAQKGCSVILISSELPEIINMCDRIYVMNAGSITGEFDSDEFSQERIMHCAATGVSDENKGGHE